MNITVQSTAFANNAAIPARYTGDGEDVSPPLNWSGVPQDTKELALIMDDPDAPSADPWVHWVLYKLSPGTTSLRQGLATSEQLDEPRGALQGKNSWGTVGYRGPAPPPGHGLHHYHFTVYALDAPLTLSAGTGKQELLQAMEGHIIVQGELVGTYQRR